MGKFSKQVGLLGALALLGLAPGSAEAALNLVPHLKLSAEERYDSAAGIVATGAVQDPLMTKISPLLGGELKDPTLDANAWYAADLLLHDSSGHLNVDHRAGISVKKAFDERSGITADLKIWQVSDPTSLPRLGMAGIDSPILYGRFDADVHDRFAQRLTGKLGYRFEGARFLKSAQTGVVHAPFAELLFASTKRLDLGVQYRFQDFVFDTDTAVAHAGLVELRYKLSPIAQLFIKGGPIEFRRSDGSGGLLPMVSAELSRQGERFDVALVVGHDLVGASGFTSALWADFASLVAEYRLTQWVKFFGVGSFYRNGTPPNVGVNPFAENAAASGYAAGAGVEWRFARNFAVQATFDRISQFGAPAGEDLARNIAAARLIVTAF